MLGLLRQLPGASVHRHYHALRACAVLQDWDGVLAAHGRLLELGVPAAPDVLTFTALALMGRRRPAEAIRLLADGLEGHPDHPDLHYALLTAAAVRFVERVASLERDGGFGLGPVATAGQARPVAEAVVQMGVFDPALLRSGLVSRDHDGGHSVRRNPPPDSGGTRGGENEHGAATS